MYNSLIYYYKLEPNFEINDLFIFNPNERLIPEGPITNRVDDYPANTGHIYAPPNARGAHKCIFNAKHQN